ncbi:hypothetical protein [Methylobacterium sp. JK268]
MTIALSICVTATRGPTVLQRLLDPLLAPSLFPFAHEVVVVDAAPEDGSRALVEGLAAEGAPLTYYRQDPRATGPAAGESPRARLLPALHRGRGRTLIAIGDDEAVVPETLIAAVQLMEARPEIGACFGPWEVHDALQIGDPVLQYDAAEEAVFGPGDAIDLLSFMLRHAMAPEIGLYRAEAAHRLLRGGRHCHPGLVALSDLITDRAVAFLTKPLCRIPTRDPLTREVHGGAGTVGTGRWDLHRGGLDTYIRAMLRRLGGATDEDQQRSLRGAVDHYERTQLRLAMRMAMAQGDYLAAHEIYGRLTVYGPAEAEQPIEDLDRLPLLVAVQTLARLAEAIPEIERVILVGVDDGPSISNLLRKLGLPRRITVSPPVAGLPDKTLQRCLVFLAERAEAERTRLVEQGYVPGLIIGEGDLVRGIHVP